MSQLEAELVDFSDDPDQLIETCGIVTSSSCKKKRDLSNDLTLLENRLENERSQAASKQAEFSKLQADLKALVGQKKRLDKGQGAKLRPSEPC